MAGFALKRTGLFPASTVVKAFPATNWPTPGIPSGAPIGSATSEKTVEATGTLPEFTGLSTNTDYWAVAEVGGVYRYIGFRVPASNVVTGERDEPEKALKNLLKVLAEQGLITDETSQT